jgi:hypothetical protein
MDEHRSGGANPRSSDANRAVTAKVQCGGRSVDHDAVFGTDCELVVGSRSKVGSL